MPENVERRGLCSTCSNAATCTFTRGQKKPVWECEEFEAEEACRIETTGTDKPSRTYPYVAEDADSDKYLGLCGDCENRQGCIFPKPEGGVWHCEEYQ